jgi:hypothetical protein
MFSEAQGKNGDFGFHPRCLLIEPTEDMPLADSIAAEPYLAAL